MFSVHMPCHWRRQTTIHFLDMKILWFCPLGQILGWGEAELSLFHQQVWIHMLWHYDILSTIILLWIWNNNVFIAFANFSIFFLFWHKLRNSIAKVTQKYNQNQASQRNPSGNQDAYPNLKVSTLQLIDHTIYEGYTICYRIIDKPLSSNNII